MAEQNSAQQTIREQLKAAETMAGSAWRAWAGLAASSSEYTFGAIEQTLHHALGTRAQADKAAAEALSSYRRVYQESLQTWQSYMQGVSEIFTRASER